MMVGAYADIVIDEISENEKNRPGAGTPKAVIGADVFVAICPIFKERRSLNETSSRICSG